MPPTSPGPRPRPPGQRRGTVSAPIPRGMSLLSNYEGLRHQIERLVRENEELKKLVRLIRENHELKSAIKTQAGAMGISGFSSSLSEGAAGSATRTSNRIYPPSVPVSTHDPGLEELGIMTLSSLADMLNTTTASPATNAMTSTLPGPLSNTTPAALTVQPNNSVINLLASNLNNQLAGAIAISPNSLLTNPLPGSTAAPSSNPVAGSVTGSLVAPPTSGSPLAGPVSGPSNNPLTMANPVTGPSSNLLTVSGTSASTSPPSGSPLTGSMTGSLAAPPTSTVSSSLPSTLSAPMTVPPISALTNSLTGSITGPPGNLLPSSVVNNMLLIDSGRPRSSLDAARHSSSGPAGSVNLSVPSATVPKVLLSNRNKAAMGWETPTDVDPFNMTFVGPPIQSSTPIGAITVGTPLTNFFSSPDSLAQANPAISAVLTSASITGSVPTSALPVTAVTSTSQPVVVAQSLHQGPATSSPSTISAPAHTDLSSATQRIQPSPSHIVHTTHTAISPPLPAQSPPRSSISSSSTNDTRGFRTSDTPHKSILEMERKMAHRKTSKLTETPRDPKQLTWERLVGEIAFQLDRRILSNIFPERVRLYGFTVSNIPEKIIQASLNTSNHKLDEELCQTLTQRYVSVMNRLQSLGYNGRVHPGLTEQLVNAYGILRERPELAASEGGSYTMDFLQRVVMETVPASMLTDALLLLSCLNQLSHDDGKPMFIW